MSSSGGKRAHKLGQIIQKELGRMLQEELKDPRIGFVTITEVRPTPDLRHAKIFVSVYDEADVRGESVAALQSAAGFIKRELGQVLRTRFVPELEFVLDDGLDRAQRLEDVMSAIHAGEHELPEERINEFLEVSDARSTMRDQAALIEEKRKSEEAQRKSRSSQRRTRRSTRKRRS
jgi:ribosome-binding factor A